MAAHESRLRRIEERVRVPGTRTHDEEVALAEMIVEASYAVRDIYGRLAGLKSPCTPYWRTAEAERAADEAEASLVRAQADLRHLTLDDDVGWAARLARLEAKGIEVARGLGGSARGVPYLNAGGLPHLNPARLLAPPPRPLRTPKSVVAPELSPYESLLGAHCGLTSTANMSFEPVRVFAVFATALALAPAQALTLHPVATGYVTGHGETLTWTSVEPPGGFENYEHKPYSSSSYWISAAGPRLELLGGSGYERFLPPYHSVFSWHTQYGWAAFRIPQLDVQGWSRPTFTATYENFYDDVRITELSFESFPSPSAVFRDVQDNAYAMVPAARQTRTLTTELWGTITHDILARQGDTFYLGLMGPCCGSWQPTVILKDMSLNVGFDLATPLPGSAWLFGGALLGMVALRRSRAASRGA
jgi:hypothetical protein